MDRLFIGWSGNQPLANELANIIRKGKKFEPEVGGGVPTGRTVNEQVIDQMEKCNYAVILVEKKDDGKISNNLMLEWGYMLAQLPPTKFHVVLINIKPSDLPSDVLGGWSIEISDAKAANQRSVEPGADAELAERIWTELSIKMHNAKDKELANRNYFDTVSNWETIYPRLQTYKERRHLSEDDVCEYIVMGCLAAYYYNNQQQLRHAALSDMTSTRAVNIVITFAKSYLDLFLNTGNMSRPLDSKHFLEYAEVFQKTLRRQRQLSESFDDFLDILAHNAYGLAALLYLKNEGLSQDRMDYYAEESRRSFETVLELLESYEDNYPRNLCLVLLIKAYMHNDMAHLYRDVIKDQNMFLEHLQLSVDTRQDLHDEFGRTYPSNQFLETKFDQEYTIALSEQLKYDNTLSPITQEMKRENIIEKYREWQSEIIFSSSLTNRIANNLGITGE